MLKEKILFLLISSVFSLSIYAQDPHFSQYFSSPLTISPANTGNMTGPSRIAANFRNQWQGVGSPYLTGTFSIETEILKNKMGEGNKLALGFLGLFDKTFGGAYKSNYFSASVGYHLWINEDMTNKLSIGFQTSLANKTLDFNNLSFAEQFTSGGFNLALPSNQTFTSGKINFIDFNTGIMYTHASELNSYYFGTSLYHVTQPVESFLSKTDYRLPIRVTFNGGTSFNMGAYDKLHLSGLVMVQGSVHSYMFGAAYEYALPVESTNVSLMFGSYYRLKDAIIPYVGLKRNDFQIGISYDATISNLNLGSTKNRSLELSMVCNFKDNSDYKKNVPWY